VTEGWEDYALLDSGAGRKLERFGPHTVDRPEPQAMWPRALPQAAWDAADAVYAGEEDESARGRWRFAGPDRDETWPTGYGPVKFLGRFTPFRHMGFFPEMVPHWDFMRERLSLVAERDPAPPKLLNLFGYTGVASLIAAAAGAEVTHVDASKKAIGYARENQALSGLDAAPIRWICDDAAKFCAREVRRGRRYRGVLVDPPKFGRGPKNEVWNIFEDLPALLADIRDILDPDGAFVILTAYAIRASFLSMHELAAETFASGMQGRLESGELAIRESGARGRLISTSLYARWAQGAAAEGPAP
jgi:23S rRNA (cytosine1962-C5)-methyltransferase